MSSAMECIKCLGSNENARQVVVAEPEMLGRFLGGIPQINTRGMGRSPGHSMQSH